MTSSESSEESNIQKIEIDDDRTVTKFLPEKSKDRYNMCYIEFLAWQKKNLTTSFSESVLLIYFNELSQVHKPPTLWSRWSMLKSLINLNQGININSYHKLKKFLKNFGKGHIPKKSPVLTLSQINKFLNEYDDFIYLEIKVILIIGVFGALRTSELIDLGIQDFDDTGKQFIVTVRNSKNLYQRNFVIGEAYYETVKKYISLRPKDLKEKRFFLNYRNGKCTRQVIGKNKFAQVPKKVAVCLKLENPESYTGHSFRRTAANLFSNAGVNLAANKELGESSSVAEELSADKEESFDAMINIKEENPSTSDIDLSPSTSTYNEPMSSTINDNPFESVVPSIAFNNQDISLLTANATSLNFMNNSSCNIQTVIIKNQCNCNCNK